MDKLLVQVLIKLNEILNDDIFQNWRKSQIMITNETTSKNRSFYYSFSIVKWCFTVLNKAKSNYIFLNCQVFPNREQIRDARQGSEF